MEAVMIGKVEENKCTAQLGEDSVSKKSIIKEQRIVLGHKQLNSRNEEHMILALSRQEVMEVSDDKSKKGRQQKYHPEVIVIQRTPLGDCTNNLKTANQVDGRMIIKQTKGQWKKESHIARSDHGNSRRGNHRKYKGI